MVRYREETKDKDDDPKAYRKDIDSNPEDARKVEGPPNEHTGLAGVMEAVPGADPASTATVEKKTLSNDVRGV